MCSHDCDGHTGEAHRVWRKCVSGVCSHDCDGFTGPVHRRAAFIEIELEEPDPFYDHRESILKRPQTPPPEPEPSSSESSEESKVSFTPDALPPPPVELEESKDSF